MDDSTPEVNEPQPDGLGRVGSGHAQLFPPLHWRQTGGSLCLRRQRRLQTDQITACNPGIQSASGRVVRHVVCSESDRSTRDIKGWDARGGGGGVVVMAVAPPVQIPPPRDTVAPQPAL